MSGSHWRATVAGICLAGLALQASAFDVFRTEAAVPSGPSSPVLGDNQICSFGPIGQPLRLQEAVERALCNGPKTREAWINVKIRAAAVGQGRAAFLPTLSGQWQGVRDDSVTDVTGHPDLSSANRATIRSASVSLSWVLYDFGGRSAALRNATELLAAAQANQDAQLQQAFGTLARDYYGAQAAQGALTAAQEIVRTAQESLTAASVRAEKGVVPLSDQLQAETAYAQAVFNRVKAEGDCQSALGTLASDMNLRPDQPIRLPPPAEGVSTATEFSDSIGDLIDEAKRTHPSVRAAQADVDAALAKEQQTRAEGLPSLSLTAKYSHNNQPATLGLGIPQFPATGHDWYIGVQVTVPFFEGFGRVYQVRQAEAETDLQRATLDEAQQQVALDVWTAYQTLMATSQNIANSATLLEVAEHSFEANQRRYTVGVGNILELLNAQSDLASARKQRIQALTDWRSARLQLAAKLGRLGMWRISRD
ncbi:TolC family protein [Paraburkholderia caledonica]|uniref:Protein CyaE n=1 Tax=Paraburkholderia caledonica TaxID=134536 RepID=A0AB73IN50_9BURK|nr:outer membrane protein [Paraburkholderia caledonica]